MMVVYTTLIKNNFGSTMHKYTLLDMCQIYCQLKNEEDYHYYRLHNAPEKKEKVKYTFFEKEEWQEDQEQQSEQE